LFEISGSQLSQGHPEHSSIKISWYLFFKIPR
jgi:hypothetical protein